MSADERIIRAGRSPNIPGGIVALDRLSLAVRRGEVVVIIGPSGSGKSTFLRCLNGLEEIDDGSIVIDGIPLDHHRKNRCSSVGGDGLPVFHLFPT
jgi:ABC-type polar amino acid transport system ATPase subunit